MHAEQLEECVHKLLVVINKTDISNNISSFGTFFFDEGDQRGPYHLIFSISATTLQSMTNNELIMKIIA